MKFKLGDTLLLIGSWSNIRDLQDDIADMVVLNMPAELDEVPPAASRASGVGLAADAVVKLVGGAAPRSRPFSSSLPCSGSSSSTPQRPR